MGAWGHGVYESDTSLDTVNFIFETIGVINDNGNILLESGDVIPTMMWNPGYGKLHSSIVKNMINNFKVLEEEAQRAEAAAKKEVLTKISEEISEAITKANDLMARNERFAAFTVLKELSLKEGFEVVNKLLPYFNLECVDYKIKKELEKMETNSYQTITNGNLEHKSYTNNVYIYHAITHLKNNSDIPLEIKVDSYDKEDENCTTILPNQTAERVTNVNWYTVKVDYPDGHGKIKKRPFLEFKLSERMKIPTRQKVEAGCFVLTACFEDYDHPTVMNFRKFRDETLLKTEIGTKFVDFYYKHSPRFANYIATKPILKRGFRNVFKLIEKLIS